MAISMRRYVDITSGIGAGVRVPGRDLIGRIYTIDPLVPTDTELVFESAADVANFFGSDTEMYRRAAFYFGFISKTQVRARKLSVVRYTPEAVPPTLRGAVAVPKLADFQVVLAGSFVLTVGGNAYPVMGLDLTGAKSYADVASAVQTGIQGISSESLFTGSTVTYNANAKTFNLTLGASGAMEMEAARNAATGSPLAPMLRWNSGSGAIVSNGRGVSSVTDTLNESADASNNFGSFLFMADLTLDAMVEAATFANLSNMMFMYTAGVTTADYADARSALQGYSGVALTETDPVTPNEYPDMCPMIMLAATDYTRRNGTINYMFHQFNLTPTVTDNTKADLMDAARVNYYGRTQQAGQLIDFYQRGVLQGDVQDMNIYANEMWLKDRAGADIMTLFLNMPEIAANNHGRSLVIGCLQNVIALALNNGAISVEKTLNYTQRAFIGEITGDDVAWIQIQSLGYWLAATVEEVTKDDRIEYIIKYLLVYAKKDVVRKVEGTHSLI